MRAWPVCLALAACDAPTPPGAKAFRSTPAAEYAARPVEGFVVHVASDVAETDSGRRALELIGGQLADVSRALPPSAVTRLREVPLYVSAADTPCPTACYHPSSEWLTTNGYEPAKAGAVEISSAATFVEWTRQQPSMVLHELAHAYHHQVLGFGDLEVQAAYDASVDAGTLEQVAHVSGGLQRHYALTSPVEWFAEFTESTYGRNDFAPVDRDALERQLPSVLRFVERKWRRE